MVDILSCGNEWFHSSKDRGRKSDASGGVSYVVLPTISENWTWSNHFASSARSSEGVSGVRMTNASVRVLASRGFAPRTSSLVDSRSSVDLR
ncbi:hypothetical protein CEE69_01385 [Rhodopirellula bahusiensis]|uniref:Uncharacterized protein n=1 Tax=Rhodopirellula bahusiensis TaxID=2014065 RepID=A0A2G1WDF0_9BACT|nr:hypothetical protein CEE69_01385 [Rhodopirellula bahusiensis]